MLVVLAVLQHVLWISLLFHWETFIEHAHTFPSLSVESPIFLNCDTFFKADFARAVQSLFFTSLCPLRVHR